MLIPKRNFLTVWDISLIQCIGNSLVGSPGIIEGKNSLHRLLFFRCDFQAYPKGYEKAITNTTKE